MQYLNFPAYYGEYFVDKKISGYHSIVDDKETRKKFWDVSFDLVERI